MKSINGIAVVLLIGMSFSQVFAQKGKNHQMENKSPVEASRIATEKLSEKLDLTDVQAESVQGILLESFTKREEIKNKYPELKVAKSEMKAVRKNGKEKMKAILTESQLEQLKTNKKQLGNQSKTKASGTERKKPEQRLEKIKSKIELTASQERELLQVFKETDNDLKAIKAKYPELDEAKAEMKVIRTETDVKMKKVLTAEQFDTYKKHKNGGNKGRKKGRKGSK